MVTSSDQFRRQERTDWTKGQSSGERVKWRQRARLKRLIFRRRENETNPKRIDARIRSESTPRETPAVNNEPVA